jgi:hypothetical protein
VRLLEEEWRCLPVSYAYREQEWVTRAVGVPTGSIPFPEAEGMVAYAMKQAQMYHDLAERAEITRTEAKLVHGKKRQVWAPSWDPVMGVEGEGLRMDDDVAGNEAAESDDDDDDEWGDVDSDEELLMGGEVDD